jgi:hypothetical protein
MQEEYSADGRLGRELETAIPVGLVVPRVGETSGAIPDQRIGGAGPDASVDILLQLCEEPILEPKVVIEAVDFGSVGGAVLLYQPMAVPRFEACPSAASDA